MNKGRVYLAILMALLLICGQSLADSPMRDDFSLGWKQLLREYQQGASIIGTQSVSIARMSGAQTEQLEQLQQVLDTLEISLSIREDERYAEVTQAGTPILSLWELHNDVWQMLGSSLLEGQGNLGIPLASGTDRQQSYDRLSTLPGLGTLLSHPIIRYFMEAEDIIPVVDVLMRQWYQLQLAMTPYADEGATRSGMNGIDAHSHCTTYILKGADIGSVISLWLVAMENDATMRWWLETLLPDADMARNMDAWFQDMRHIAANSVSSSSLTLRVYLDLYDEVCGITGSTTLRLGNERIPFSVTYKKKTSGNRVRHTLTLNCQPDSHANGAKVDLTYVTSNNETDRTARSLETTVSGYWQGEPYRIKLSWDYENLWQAQEKSTYAENISGSGKLDLRYANDTVEKVTWSQAQQIKVDPNSPDSLMISDTLTFDALTVAGTITGTYGKNGSRAELQNLEDAVSLAGMDDQTVDSLGRQLRNDWDQWLTAAFGTAASLFLLR